MNKREIKAELEVCKRIDNLTNSNLLKWIREDLQSRLIELETQLAEAEKPKLRHGDCITQGVVPRIVLNRKESKGQFASFSKAACDLNGFNYAEQHKCIVHFNIFDLMKDWDKDFKNIVLENDYDGRVFLIQKSLLNERDIYLGTEDRGKRMGVYLTNKEAEEIWKQLGHAIIFARRSK